MDIKIKKITEPIPHAKIADVLWKTYFKEYGNAGALQWSEEYAKFYFESILPKESSRDFIFGAFDKDRLVGTTIGHRDVVVFENRLNLETVNLGLTAVDPEYKRQGIAKKLVSRLMDHAKEKKLDIVMAFPEKGRFGDKLLKDYFDFTNFGKAKHLIKLMEERGLEVLREYMKMNVILVKLAGIFSHIPEIDELDGTIRPAKIEETDEVREILNSYATRVPLVNFYSHDGYKESNLGFAKMNERFGDPWGFHWLVLERNRKIMATLSYRVEIVSFEIEEDQLESAPVALMTSLGCHESLELDDKVQFVAAILRNIRTELPEIFVSQITSPQHELKVFDKLKFNKDRNTYFLYIKPLTEKGEELNTYKKFKEHLLNYYR
ncbi:MAG: GNAT family N-acetyltransferase [Candidatus Helarchaeota archaeon]|nr:GNAT family N-acetyltransferase [Candidatus Helarchaeota archaeon]